jgi:hypothetical protein
MKGSLKYHYILFVISPFLAFLLALRRGFDKRYQRIILAFSFIYGYGVYLYSGDILGYQETYAAVNQYNWSDFWYIITHKLDPVALNAYPPNAVNRKPDVFALVLMFFSSRLSDSPRLFWGLVSMIYTWFMLLFLNEAKRHFKIERGSWIHFALVFFFIIVIPKYVGVTGVRFWPALYLFMYYLLRYTRSGYSIKFILFAALSTLVHYSFFVPVLLLSVFHFVPFKRIFSRFLVLASVLFFLLSSTTGIFNILQKAVEATDETTIGQSAESYADQDIYEQNAGKVRSTNWYVQVRASAHYYLFLIVFLLEIVGLLKLRETPFSELMLPVVILFFCLTLLTFNLGSIGRFKNIFMLLIILRYIIIFPLNRSSVFFKSLGVVLIPIVSLYFLVVMRAELYYVESYFPVHNAISFFFFRSDESLSEFIVGH